MSVEVAIEELKKEMGKNRIDATSSLGEELFLFTSSLTPIINSDILIVDNGKLLLSWRADSQCGIEWHLPGG